MTTPVYVLLAIGAVIASLISGVTGVGGGMVYLPLLTWGVGIKRSVVYLTMLLVVSNISRAWFSRRNIDWQVLKHFAIGCIPGALIGAVFYTLLSTFWIKKALGVYLLTYVALSFTRSTWPRTATLNSIRWIGLPAGFVSAVVGGSGPVVVPWFLRYGLVKEAFLATEAVGAATMHAVKLVTWSGAGLITLRDVVLLLPLGVLMIAGSYLGKVLVSRMPIRVFRSILIFVLAVIGLRFLLF